MAATATVGITTKATTTATTLTADAQQRWPALTGTPAVGVLTPAATETATAAASNA
jgi:hypothetical protein